MVDINVGDIITVNPDTRYDRAGDSYPRRLEVGSIHLRVTRVYTDKVMARGPLLGAGEEASVYVWRQDIVTVNEGGTVRKLGLKPEDTPEMTHIAIDDPRIQWLFDDMAEFATRQRYCSQYDQLCAQLGIPGRKRKFTGNTVIGGVTFRGDVEARSQEEADVMVRTALLTVRSEVAPAA